MKEHKVIWYIFTKVGRWIQWIKLKCTYKGAQMHKKNRPTKKKNSSYELKFHVDFFYIYVESSNQRSVKKIEYISTSNLYYKKNIFAANM